MLKGVDMQSGPRKHFAAYDFTPISSFYASLIASSLKWQANMESKNFLGEFGAKSTHATKAKHFKLF